MIKKAILIVEDEPEMRRKLCESFSVNGYQSMAAANGEAALRLLETNPFDTVIASSQLPDLGGMDLLEALRNRSPMTPVILIADQGRIEEAVAAMKRGAFDYLCRPLASGVLEEAVAGALSCRPSPEDGACEEKPIVTQDPRMQEILSLGRRIAPSKAPVLIQGESGTGKELFARYIHAQSLRREGPFVAVNCASLPETLLESELFGHEKGAFTGAIARKVGKFELAHRGTLLLDEISELNTFLQAKLLRVLQENEVDRIGGSRPVPVDIRVIATTNQDLESCISRGEFREDLFYRLNVIRITLPPLRERGEDIELLAGYYLRKFSADYRKPLPPLSAEAGAWLKGRNWRGNIRELRNTLERAVLLCAHPVLEVADFAPEEPAAAKQREEQPFSSLCLKEMEQKMIFQALERTNGNRTHAAKMLGISIRTLRNKLQEYRAGLPAGAI